MLPEDTRAAAPMPPHRRPILDVPAYADPTPMRTPALALIMAAAALAACQSQPEPAPPAPAPAAPAAPPPAAGEDQDPNLKALPSAPVGRQSLPPASPR